MEADERDKPLKSILQRLKEKNPDRNIVFTAIEELQDPDEIRMFMDEYIHYVADNTEDEQAHQDKGKIAGRSVGYALGFYDKPTANRWFSAIKGLEHPVFGTNIPFNDSASAYQVGRVTGNLQRNKN